MILWVFQQACRQGTTIYIFSCSGWRVLRGNGGSLCDRGHRCRIRPNAPGTVVHYKRVHRFNIFWQKWLVLGLNKSLNAALICYWNCCFPAVTGKIYRRNSFDITSLYAALKYSLAESLLSNSWFLLVYRNSQIAARITLDHTPICTF